jgi:hypothetical protein
VLAPTVRPDDIVLLDNLSSHKIAGIEQAITAQGARPLYLPPPAFAGAGSTVPASTRSSRPSPNSQAFAKFKAALRKAAERTREGLWQTIGRTLDLYPPQECRNFFYQAGYAIRRR